MKFWLLSAVLITALQSAHAQQPSIFNQEDVAEPHTFFGGLTAGANFSQVDGDGEEGYHKVGLHAGALVYVHLRGQIYGSVEMLYTQKGSKTRTTYESPYTGTSVEGYDIKLNYVEVPVMLRYNYKPRWGFGAGVSYARLVKSDEEAFENYPINLYPDINYFHKEDWCGVAELTYEFSTAWLITMRFQYSLTSIRDADRIPQGFGGGNFPGQWNNLFSLRLVYFLHAKT